MDVGLQDGFDGESVVADDFLCGAGLAGVAVCGGGETDLLHEENGEMGRNGDFSESHGAEQGRLSDT